MKSSSEPIPEYSRLRNSQKMEIIEWLKALGYSDKPYTFGLPASLEELKVLLAFRRKMEKIKAKESERLVKHLK